MAKLPNSIENLIDQVSGLPGIGPKSASKLVLGLVTGNKDQLIELSDSLRKVHDTIGVCKTCGNLIEANSGRLECAICLDDERENRIMVVENIADLVNIENARAFDGYYHILNGLVSPVRGIGIDDLNIESLIERLSISSNEEIICALPSNIEGDTTALLLKDIVNSKFPPVNFYRLGRGLPSGANIEFLDSDTLRNSVQNITQY